MSIDDAKFCLASIAGKDTNKTSVLKRYALECLECVVRMFERGGCLRVGESGGVKILLLIVMGV